MHLNDLVPNIYKELEALSNGEALPLTEEEIDRTIAGMREALVSWATPRKRDTNFTVRMSNVGKRLC